MSGDTDPPIKPIPPDEGLVPHPVAQENRPLTDEEYQALLISMKTHGFDASCPILVHGNQIIDGIHRYRAATELGIEYVTAECPPDQIELRVLHRQIARRNLTKPERSVLAAKIFRLQYPDLMDWEKLQSDNETSKPRLPKPTDAETSMTNQAAQFGAMSGTDLSAAVFVQLYDEAHGTDLTAFIEGGEQPTTIRRLINANPEILQKVIDNTATPREALEEQEALSLLSTFAESKERFSLETVKYVAELVNAPTKILDPFGGIGGIYDLSIHGAYEITCVDINARHSNIDPRVEQGDACDLPYGDGSFDAVVTAPSLGSIPPEVEAWLAAATLDPRSENDLSALCWGDSYREVAELAWQEIVRVLKPSGALVVVLRDHQQTVNRTVERQPVAGWHINTLSEMGLDLRSVVAMPSPAQSRRVTEPMIGSGDVVADFVKPSSRA